MGDELWRVMDYLACDSPVELSYRPKDEIALACSVLGIDLGVVLAALRRETRRRKR